MKLTKHPNEQVKASQEELERANGPEIPNAWRKLAEALLAQISEDNVYLFVLSVEGHVRACNSLLEHYIHCGAEYPKYLRATGLRKQIAIVSQVMNLKENELDVPAIFLGHDIQTHRQYYRLPNSTLQVAKVSQVLMKMERGHEGLERVLMMWRSTKMKVLCYDFYNLSIEIIPFFHFTK